MKFDSWRENLKPICCWINIHTHNNIFIWEATTNDLCPNYAIGEESDSNLLISPGKYQPQPHIAQKLWNFSDEKLTIKQIQQFLGIINYIRNFISKLAKYTSPLSQLLRKNPPPWEMKHTEAVKALKRDTQTPPALKIHGNGKKILQTDASDHY